MKPTFPHQQHIQAYLTHFFLSDQPQLCFFKPTSEKSDFVVLKDVNEWISSKTLGWPWIGIHACRLA